MANMSGFSVFQPAVGAALRWLPALGTQELDDMINAYLPGNASIQDKRAHISVDFFMHFQQTGLNSKFYAVPPSFTTTTATSPASSAFYDSAYGSSFNASPVVSTMSPWTEPTTVITPSLSANEPKSKSKARPITKKPAASSSRQSTVDFASHPGMRIMTKDGRDVTNSASRGCKTKEQRDHAHLMRIIKACDSCKRKKIRCDPSHRKRTASQASSSSSQTESKPTKKLRNETTESPPVPFGVVPDFNPDFFASPEAASASSSFESTPESVDDLWTQFVAFDQEPEPLANNFNFTLDDFNFDSYIDPQTLLTPGLSDSSASPSQWFTPFSPTTPAPPGPSPPVIATGSTSSDSLFNDSAQDLTVPYLNPGVPHGTSYQDFNLYSPPADFFLDEEPLPVTKSSRPSGGRQSSPPSDALNDVHVTLHRNSAPGTGSVVAPMQECYSSQQQPSAGGDKPRSRIIQNRNNIHTPTSLTDYWCPDKPHDAARVHDGDGSPALQSYGLPPLSSQHVSTQPSRSQSSSASTDVHGGSLQSGYLQSQRPSGAPTAVYASLSPAQGQLLLRSSSHGDQLATSLPSSSSSPAATNYRSLSPGRSLPVDQQLQTLSTHATATVASSGSLVVTRQQSNVMISPTMMATSESRHVTATSHLDFRPALQAYGQSEAGVLQGGMMGAQALAVAFAAVLTTLPMRRLGGSDAKNESRGSLSLFHLVVFGLVSSLLVLGLQMHFLGQQGGFNTLVLASISLASMLRSSRRPDSTPTPSGDDSVRLAPKPAPTSNGTIDNVKTKIQPLGYGFRSLRCAVSQQLRTFVPRFSSLNIKF